MLECRTPGIVTTVSLYEIRDSIGPRRSEISPFFYIRAERSAEMYNMRSWLSIDAAVDAQGWRADCLLLCTPSINAQRKVELKELIQILIQIGEKR